MTRRLPRRLSLFTVLALVANAAATSCSKDNNVNQRNTSVVGEPCGPKTPCADGTCAFGFCRPPCTNDSDCAAAGVCLSDGQTKACRLPFETKCSASNPCAAGLVCSPDGCRTPCDATRPCDVAGQACSSGACTSAASGTGGAGGAGGTAGTGGMSGGGGAAGDSGACPAGFADCDGAPGCETNVNTLANCGGCGKKCTGANGTGLCDKGVCTVVCSPGFGDCDGNAANGCEQDLGSSDKNCGLCKRDCLGGKCSAGMCDAIELWKSTEELAPYVAGNASYVLVYNNAQPYKLFAVPRQGGGSILVTTGTGTIGDIVADDQNAYFRLGNGIARVAIKPSSVASVFATFSTPPNGFYIAQAGSEVYWNDSKEIHVQAKSGTTSSVLYTAPSGSTLGELWADDAMLYFLEVTYSGTSSTNHLKRLPLGGGSPSLLTTLGTTWTTSVVSDTTHVYVAVPANPPAGKIVRFNKTNWQEQTVVSEPTNAVTADGSAVYFVPIVGAGDLKRAPKDGSGLPLSIAKSGGWLFDVDSTHVYGTSNAGVWAVPK